MGRAEAELRARSKTVLLSLRRALSSAAFLETDRAVLSLYRTRRAHDEVPVARAARATSNGGAHNQTARHGCPQVPRWRGLDRRLWGAAGHEGAEPRGAARGGKE